MSIVWASQVALVVMNLPANVGDARDMGQEDPWVRMIPWMRPWQPTPILLPGEFHEQRSLVGYSPWVVESDTTERLSTLTSLVFVSA